MRRILITLAVIAGFVFGIAAPASATPVTSTRYNYIYNGNSFNISALVHPPGTDIDRVVIGPRHYTNAYPYGFNRVYGVNWAARACIKWYYADTSGTWKFWHQVNALDTNGVVYSPNFNWMWQPVIIRDVRCV